MRAVQLHPVDPAPLTALRSSSESLYHLPDLGLAHRDGHYPEYRAWKIAGRPWGAPVNWDPVMSRVPSLLEHPHAVGPDGPHQLFVPFDYRIVEVADRKSTRLNSSH